MKLGKLLTKIAFVYIITVISCKNANLKKSQNPEKIYKDGDSPYILNQIFMLSLKTTNEDKSDAKQCLELFCVTENKEALVNLWAEIEKAYSATSENKNVTTDMLMNFLKKSNDNNNLKSKSIKVDNKEKTCLDVVKNYLGTNEDIMARSKEIIQLLIPVMNLSLPSPPVMKKVLLPYIDIHRNSDGGQQFRSALNVLNQRK